MSAPDPIIAACMRAFAAGIEGESDLVRFAAEETNSSDAEVEEEVRRAGGYVALQERSWGFAVDTNLFRELGELLVGRESTALAELIKNAYDADATHAIVEGRSLESMEHGTIRILDDGVGMSLLQFKAGFLTIASRYKSEAQRRSVRYDRRVTGAKGIGRLAAHKLAKRLELESRQWTAQGDETPVISASIDWEEIERSQTLDDVRGSGAIIASARQIDGFPYGTSIFLRSLRRSWTEAERVRFYNEVISYTPPTALVNLSPDLLDRPLLFDSPHVRDTAAKDPGFEVSLQGDFDVGDEYWANVVAASDWLVEVDALPTRGKKVHVRISPTAKFLSKNPNAEGGYVEMDREAVSAPHFQARILIRTGSALAGAPRTWMTVARGIRVYMEGFRVLPYGERGDDWLYLDRDTKARAKLLTLIGEQTFGPAVDNEGLSTVGNESYFGAVFLTVAGAPGLRMLVNREGFVPSPEFDALENTLRRVLQFATRIRARATSAQRTARREAREQGAAMRANAGRQELREEVEAAVARASQCTADARRAIANGDVELAANLVDEAASYFSSGSELAERLLSERALLHLLASVGAQMTAFVHDLNSLIMACNTIERSLKQIDSSEPRLSPAGSYTLGRQARAVEELRRNLERQSAFFRDISVVDVRRRREPLNLHERFDAVMRLFEGTSKRIAVEVVNDIPGDIVTPKMLVAELSAILTNLLSNALKAAGSGGKVWASAKQDGAMELTIQNTGVAVDLADSDRLFRPFVSESTSIDATLGQGMGMGLTIVRNIVGELGGDVAFVTPAQGFSTAVRVLLK